MLLSTCFNQQANGATLTIKNSTVVNKNIPPNALGLNTQFDCAWELQKACDEIIQEADAIIGLQLEAYKSLTEQNKQLQSALDAQSIELQDAQNPPFHKDPLYMGLLGVLAGMFFVLSVK